MSFDPIRDDLQRRNIAQQQLQQQLSGQFHVEPVSDYPFSGVSGTERAAERTTPWEPLHQKSTIVRASEKPVAEREVEDSRKTVVEMLTEAWNGLMGWLWGAKKSDAVDQEQDPSSNADRDEHVAANHAAHHAPNGLHRPTIDWVLGEMMRQNSHHQVDSMEEYRDMVFGMSIERLNREMVGVHGELLQKVVEDEASNMKEHWQKHKDAKQKHLDLQQRERDLFEKRLVQSHVEHGSQALISAGLAWAAYGSAAMGASVIFPVAVLSAGISCFKLLPKSIRKDLEAMLPLGPESQLRAYVKAGLEAMHLGSNVVAGLAPTLLGAGGPLGSLLGASQAISGMVGQGFATHFNHQGRQLQAEQKEISHSQRKAQKKVKSGTDTVSKAVQRQGELYKMLSDTFRNQHEAIRAAAAASA